VKQRGGEPRVRADLHDEVIAGRRDGVFPRGEGAVGAMRGQGGDLVGVPRLDTPGRVLPGDERLAVGLPAELPRDGLPRYC